MLRLATKRVARSRAPRIAGSGSNRVHPNSLAAVERGACASEGDATVPSDVRSCHFTPHTHGFTTFAAKLALTERDQQQQPGQGAPAGQSLEPQGPQEPQEREEREEETRGLRSETQPVVPDEIVSKYRSKMESLQKRRKRVPLSAGESYESWLETNDELLEPLREFFRLHEMDASWAIAELYKNGYWGKKLMTGHARRDRGASPGGQTSEGSSQAPMFPWETALDVWSTAFEEESLPHSPMDIVRRWPSLLCKTPDCLPGTVAVLRAAITDEDALNDTIAMFPRVLVQSPVKLQHRVLALQMACGMDLSRILPKNPQLFYRNLDAIMTNIRYLRDHSWTLEHFESLIEYRPNVLSMHPDMVKKNTESSLEALKMILPEGADPKVVVRAKPQLILVPAAHIDERWSILKSMTDQVPEWQAELDEAIQDVREAGSGAIEVKARNDGTGNDEMNADQGADGAQDEEMDWDRGEWGATTIGAALWSHPKRYERMQYLLETGKIGSGDNRDGEHVPSFVDILTVHLHRFSHRYQGFNAWVDARESSSSQ